MSDVSPIAGGCHCGNISFTLNWPAAESVIPVRDCGCTFCRKHGGAWTSNRDADLAVVVNDDASVCRYHFGTQSADFYVCSRCGAVPFVVSNIDDVDYAVVNTNTFQERDKLTFDRNPTDFEGEDTGTRLGRRKRNWIPDVHISSFGT